MNKLGVGHKFRLNGRACRYSGRDSYQLRFKCTACGAIADGLKYDDGTWLLVNVMNSEIGPGPVGCPWQDYASSGINEEQTLGMEMVALR